MQEEGTTNETTDYETTNVEQEVHQRPAKQPGYNSKKPKWWIKQCGNPTRAQKRATNEVFKTHRICKLPYGSYLDWNTIFSPGRDIWLEIGFGRGENLLALAHRKRNERVSLVGIEIHKPGMATACQRIQQGLAECRYWADYNLYSPALDPFADQGLKPEVENGDHSAEELIATYENTDTPSAVPYENVRLYPGDGVKLLPYIQTSSIATILVTFPDPFPETREKQWRLIQGQTVQDFYRVLRKSPNEPGKFFLATDHEGYHNWCHEIMTSSNDNGPLFEELVPCPNRLDWLPAVSRYERKGWDEGRRTRLSCWVVKPGV